MPFRIDCNKPLKIFVKETNIKSISLAVDSFIDDLTKISATPILVDKETEADIVIGLYDSSAIEEYSIAINSKRIMLQGSDDLGVIYSIYTFLENELKVNPMYKIEGLSLVHRDLIIIKNKTYKNSPNSRFRGWFINDEDMLGSFKSIHTREVPDYPFYHDVINPHYMDLIAETALRNKLNVIIPSTLINILSPFERELVDICSDRGLYISQHHIEPLGVSKYGFTQYCKRNNLNETFSYLDNHDAMSKCWKEYVKAWAKYPRVIFQVGLRGGGDRPFWSNNKEITDDKQRGEIISNAINEQYQIIEDNYPYEIHATSTLWMEGADLLKNGFINIPKDIILVLSDIGMSQLFGDDFFTINRESNVNYGIYYHSAYWHTGPHLAEGVLPQKIKYCFELAKEKNNLYYTMVNAANVKETNFTLYLTSRLSFDNTLSLKQLFDDYASLFFIESDNKKQLVKAIKSYYSSLKDCGEKYYDYFCHKYNFSYHKYENLNFPVLSFNDGLFKAIVYCFYYKDREPLRTPILRKASKAGSKSMSATFEMFNCLSNALPNEYQIGFNQHWTYQSLFMAHYLKSGLYFYDACDNRAHGKIKVAKRFYHLSSEELKYILKIRKKFFVGEYKDWLNNDKKIDINFLRKRILKD